MSNSENKIKNYLKATNTIELATVNEDNQPVIRTLGGFVVDDFTTYFLTAKKAEKVKQIENNNNVAILFQHENQVIPNFVNITINGIAENIKDIEEFNRAAQLIKARKPHLNISQENNSIYKVVPQRAKILDFTKENIEERIKLIEF